MWTLGSKAVVVDPALTEPVMDWLEQRQLNLIAVLQTHHHSDHIGGTEGLIKHWTDAIVVASANDTARIPFQTLPVRDGEEVSLLGSSLKVLEVPGHTNAHLAYFLSSDERGGRPPAIFCGDTLFAAGCGRLFEGSAEEMHNSLQLLSSLPEDTEVYCAHEYTESNLRWANALKPENIHIKKRLEEVIELRKKGLSTLPSNIAKERLTNLFIQVENSHEFSKLRHHKDKW